MVHKIKQSVPSSAISVFVMSIIVVMGMKTVEGEGEEGMLLTPSKLKMFVDELPCMPKVFAYQMDSKSKKPLPKTFSIGMFFKTWKFHRDLPPTPVFAYGTTKRSASIPGPTIEAVHGVPTHITWQNLLPPFHILPFDPTIPIANPSTGIATVVHLHGGIHAPESDGHSGAWFTSRFKKKGPTWKTTSYKYNNMQQPGTLWYHDHAMGLTRVNILAGLSGAYVIRQHDVEGPLGLPSGEEFDRVLVVFDRGFYANGSLYMNRTGNNPNIHPQWQPEYFGDIIIVNGKAWPRMTVQRRKYRFRIINTSNARFFNFYFTNGLKFVHVASDSAYIEKPVVTNQTLLAPSEIADIIVDFSKSKSNSAILANDAPYPFPSGDPVNDANSKVMKFIISLKKVIDPSRIPARLVKYPRPELSSASRTRYIAMYEYTTPSDEPTHLYINGLSYDDPVTETPKVGSSEIWYVINLTDDNHPLHIHLALFVALEQTELVEMEKFKECMMKINDATKCHVDEHARGKKKAVKEHETGWKNVYKIKPGFITKILVRFAYINSNMTYTFDATAEPGYVYHCHILDHEDNVMMRPLKLIP